MHVNEHHGYSQKLSQKVLEEPLVRFSSKVLGTFSVHLFQNRERTSFIWGRNSIQSWHELTNKWFHCYTHFKGDTSNWKHYHNFYSLHFTKTQGKQIWKAFDQEMLTLFDASEEADFHLNGTVNKQYCLY